MRKGLHIFIGTALKENPYQDTPKFRGLFLSSSQYENDEKGNLESRGLFLHEFFSRFCQLTVTYSIVCRVLNV